MSSVRNWTAASVVGALILLSPVIAFLLVLVAEVLIDLLSEVGAVALLDLLPAVVIGCLLFRRISPHPEVAVQTGAEKDPDEGAIAARPM